MVQELLISPFYWIKNVVQSEREVDSKRDTYPQKCFLSSPHWVFICCNPGTVGNIHNTRNIYRAKLSRGGSKPSPVILHFQLLLQKPLNRFFQLVQCNQKTPNIVFMWLTRSNKVKKDPVFISLPQGNFVVTLSLEGLLMKA